MIVDGRLSQRRWEAEDGGKRSKHEVVAQNIRFMPRREGAAVPGDAPPRAAAAGAGVEVAPPDFTDDDIPF